MVLIPPDLTSLGLDVQDHHRRQETKNNSPYFKLFKHIRPWTDVLISSRVTCLTMFNLDTRILSIFLTMFSSPSVSSLKTQSSKKRRGPSCLAHWNNLTSFCEVFNCCFTFCFVFIVLHCGSHLITFLFIVFIFIFAILTSRRLNSLLVKCFNLYSLNCSSRKVFCL